jgi:hypothetical protein
VNDQTINRTELPIRRPPFRGVVKRTLDGSQPDWNYVAPLTPPEGAPNILLILTDDAGFGNPATFGGPIRTPALDRLAAGGLKYNGFHVTAMQPDTGGVDDRAKPSRRGLRHGQRIRRAVPRLLGDAAQGLPDIREDLAGQRLFDSLLR